MFYNSSNLLLTAFFSAIVTFAPLTSAQGRLVSGSMEASVANSFGWPRFDTKEMDAAYGASARRDWNTAIINYERAMKREEAKGGSYNWNYCLWAVAESGRTSARETKSRFSRSHPQIGQSVYVFNDLFKAEMEKYSSFSYSIPDECLD